jgi:tetratricopeptide (TPR) repeat protein
MRHSMTHCRALAAALLLSSFLPASPARAQAAPLEKWRSLRTPNFQLLGDVGEGDMRRVAARLEQFREAVGIILPRATVTTATPTVVIVFKSHKNYRPFKPIYQGKPQDHIAGYFMPGQGMNFVTMTIESRGGDPDEALRIVYHELVHLMVRNTTAGVPPWLNEGLAEYYETLEITDGGKRGTVGRVEPRHVLTLREEFIPIEQLAAVDRHSPLYNERTKASIFYAESWALVHYLLIDDTVNKTTRASALIDALSSGASFAEACQRGLGLSPAALETALKKYVRRDSFTSFTLKLTERIATIEKLPAPLIEAGDAHAAVGTLLLQMDRRDEARSQLSAALASTPQNALALTAMGQLLMREGKRDEALPYLERASAAPGAPALVHYQHAAALHQAYDDGTVRPKDVDAAIETAYRRAIALDATHADSYAGLARIMADRGVVGREPLDLMMKAIQLAPGRNDYRVNFGIMLANREAFADARTVLAPVASGSDEGGSREAALSVLKRIDEYEARRAQYEKRRAAAGVTEASSERFAGPVVMPDLRVPQAGEERAFGVLVAIECPRGRVRLVIMDGDRAMRVHAGSFEGVEFITYRNDLTGEISCGARKTQDPVLVTYRPAPADGSAGEVVAVEFVPLSYRHK